MNYQQPNMHMMGMPGVPQQMQPGFQQHQQPQQQQQRMQTPFNGQQQMNPSSQIIGALNNEMGQYMAQTPRPWQASLQVQERFMTIQELVTCFKLLNVQEGQAIPQSMAVERERIFNQAQSKVRFFFPMRYRRPLSTLLTCPLGTIHGN
jgi:molybdopterin-biosynthesis enzyme MoeA-like protein